MSRSRENGPVRLHTSRHLDHAYSPPGSAVRWPTTCSRLLMQRHQMPISWSVIHYPRPQGAFAIPLCATSPRRSSLLLPHHRSKNKPFVARFPRRFLTHGTELSLLRARLSRCCRHLHKVCATALLTFGRETIVNL